MLREAAAPVALKPIRLAVGVAVGGVGENQSRAEAQRHAGGFQRVATGGDVIHKIRLAQRQGFGGADKVVRFPADRALRVAVALALGTNCLRAGDGFDHLRRGGGRGN